MKSKIVGIMGTPVSSGNRGVQALGASLVELCLSSAEKVEPFLLLNHDNHRAAPFRVGGHLQMVPVVNCRLSPQSRACDHLAWIVAAAVLYRFVPFAGLRKIIVRYTPWIAALERATFVGDIRGGDSFSDIYGMRRFLLGFLMSWSVLLVKGKMVQFPQTYGPYKSPLARFLARYLLQNSEVVVARDVKSAQVAQALIGSRPKVGLSPDVAFSLGAIRPPSIALDPPLAGAVPAGVIGINVNGLMYNGGYTRKNMFGLQIDYRSMLPELIRELSALHAGELWLVPHTYGPAHSVESDPQACRLVRAALPQELQERVRIVTGEYDQHEIKGVIGLCDFFIGSRMHACIAALSQGVPAVGVAYSRKFAGVFDSVGLQGWVVDGRMLENRQAIELVLQLYKQRETVRADLAHNATRARKRLRAVFQTIFALTDDAAGSSKD